jgi:2-amino-4-hydroxy-6-hydroxymethyldihydropteridine diphosphokinase
MPTVYIGIGSNLGNRVENCEHAIGLLNEYGIKATKSSSKIETEPWGVTDQPRFINMAVKAETDHEPRDLLHALKNIENEMGRSTGIRWGPRVIDLDILLYNSQIIKIPDLEIPHPGMQDRDFVLKPLAEIAPDIQHPVFRKSIRELLHELLKRETN